LRRVRVATTARLHLGFLDLNGNLGRRFGSIGVSIDAFETAVELRDGAAFQALGHERERSAALAMRIAEYLHVDAARILTVADAIPAHVGLGSGTQLAMAIAAAFRAFSGLPPDPLDDARRLERGARSGVGVALFERGGLVVDAGRGPRADPPPVVSWLAVPEEWRILLVMDRRVVGVHSEEERRAFAALPHFPAEAAGEICRRTLMQVLPGLAERDLDAFGDGIARIQEIVGDHFAHVQGGRFTSPAVGRVAERLKSLGARGVGQSSWGPTGFAFARDTDEAKFLAAQAGAEAETGVEIIVCRALNHGAQIEADKLVSQR